MSSIDIQDLPVSTELDRKAMSEVRGGTASLPGMGSIANVNVGVNLNQQIMQLQQINVNALNHIGVIGASFPFHLSVNPTQYATTGFGM